ncbi:MAG: hypothetical protein MI919_30575, partial [Holophagales bacterium]|nr:hypothetical protein [Holophagales bacterium]
RFVETMPRRGYRFVASVERIDISGEIRAEAEGSRPPGMARTEARATGAVGARPSIPLGRDGFPSSSGPRRAGRLLTILAVAAAAVVGSAVWLGLPGKPAVSGSSSEIAPIPAGDAEEQARRMLLVLPFENLDPTPEREFFARGLTDELISQLGSLRPDRLGVVARTSALAYAGRPETVSELAAEVGVELVLEGSVRSDDPIAPTRLRIHARLIDAVEQTPLWSGAWDPPSSGVLRVQREIAVEVARALALELLPGDLRALARSATTSAEAYEAYLRGRESWYRFDIAGLEEAVELFGHALALDPTYVHAESGLAEAHNLLAVYRGPQAEHFELAKAAARRALALEPGVAEAHNALAYAQLYHDWDFPAAEASFERALQLAPNFAMAHHYATGLYSALGRHEEALAAGHRAQHLDPESLSVRSDLGWYYLFAGRPDGAIRECERTLDSDPHYGWAVSCLVEAHAMAGNGPAARDAVLRRLRLDGTGPATLERIAAGPALEAVRGYRERVLARQVAELGEGRGWAFGAAGTSALLGRADQAFVLLEQALEERDIWMVFLGVHPAFRSLQGDPRLADLLRRIGLPPPRKEPSQSPGLS